MATKDAAPKYGGIDFPEASGTMAQDLREVMTKVLQALTKWRQAVRGSPDQSMWTSRIDEVEKMARNVSGIMTDELVFPGRTQQTAYNDAIRAYLSLNDDLFFAADTLPRPELLDQAKSFIDSIGDFPAEVIKGIGDALAKVGAASGEGVGAAIAAAFKELAKNLWPILLIGGAALVVYEVGPTRIMKGIGLKK